MLLEGRKMVSSYSRFIGGALHVFGGEGTDRVILCKCCNVPPYNSQHYPIGHFLTIDKSV